MRQLRLTPVLLLTACGRVAFDGLADGSGSSDDAAGDAITDAERPPAGGVAPLWYRMNEGGGTVLVDSGTERFNALLSGNYQRTPSSVRFVGGGAITDALPGKFRTYPVTIMAWMTPEARDDQTSNAFGLTPYPANAVSNDLSGIGGFGIGANVWTDGTPGSSLRVGWVSPTVTATFASGTRYHVAIVYAPNQACFIYVNGALLTSRGTAAADGMVGELRIGFHNPDTGYGTKRFFVGEIDDVRIYTRLFTEGEVAAVFADGPR